MKCSNLKFIHQSGFTLVEVMIALVLFVLMLLLLFSNLFTARQYWQSSEIIIEKNDEKRLINQFLRTHISQSIPIIWADTNKRELLFQGETEQVDFISSLPAHRGGGGLYALSLYIQEKDEMNSLQLSYSLLIPEQKPFSNEANVKTVTLVNDIKSFAIQYFGNKKDERDSSWFNNWENENLLPKLIRIEISQNKSGSLWPLLDIPIKADTLQSPEFILQKSVAFQ